MFPSKMMNAATTTTYKVYSFALKRSLIGNHRYIGEFIHLTTVCPSTLQPQFRLRPLGKDVLKQCQLEGTVTAKGKETMHK